METKRKKGTGTIVEKNGKYRAELQYVNPYTQKNTKLRGTLRSRKKDAEIDLRELQEKRDYILEASSPNVDSITVAAYYRNIFLPYKHKQLKEGNSYSRFESTVENHIISALGMRRLLDITSADINKLLEIKKADGYSYSSVKKIHDGLGSMFTFAAKKGDLMGQNNPMSGVYMIREDQFENSEAYFLSPQEIQELEKIATIKTHDGNYAYKYGYLYLFMLNSGLREGETCALNKSDFDFENKLLTVNKSINQIRERKPEGGFKYTLKISTPKNKNSVRFVPLNDEAIIYAKKVMEIFDKSDLFVYGTHNELVRPDVLIKSFYRVLEKANIPKMGLHVLRHTFVSMLFESNVDIHTIASIIGDTVNTVEKTYLHLYRARKMRAVQATNIVTAAKTMIESGDIE